MLRVVMIAVLAIAVIGTGYWGYQEHQDKNAVLINAENNYQRAFHDLVYHVDLLHDKIGTTLAMSSREQLSPSLAEVWRVSSEAQNDVGQLPLALLPFNKTEEFLHQIGDYSYEVAVRDLNDNPLSQEEYDTLEHLYSRATEIQEELRKVQNMVIKNNLRWMDVEVALSAQNQPHDNTIINGFKTVEKNVSSYDEAEFGPTFTSMKQDDNSFQYLEGSTITEQEAKEVAREVLDLEGNEEIVVTENGEGSSVGFYSLTISNGDEKNIYIDITKKGGYPIYVIQNREITGANISLKEASDKASEYLQDHDFDGFTLYESAQYDNTGAFTFVNEVDGVKIYPDAIRMKVSLDDGDIIGFSAKDYLMAHHNRDIPQPSITKEEAEKQINRRVSIMEDGLAIIKSDTGEEILCYEFFGTINNDTYHIFINAENGREERVQKMKNAEQAYSF